MAQEQDVPADEFTRPVPVKIFTSNNLITGFVHVPSSGYRGRVSDLLNQEDFEFLAVTEARLYSHDGTVKLAEEACVIINKRIIQTVIPEGEYRPAAGPPV
ncbi:MAG: DUF6812 domain-containing protein [Actinomycetota bacterium]